MERTGSVAAFLAYAVVYHGLFLLPVLAAVAIGAWGGGGRRDWRWLAGFVGLFALILAVTAWQWPRRLPYLGNVLYDLGAGPLLLPGMVEGRTIAAPVRLGGGWWVVTALAIAGGCFFMASAGRTVARAVSSMRRRAADRDPGFAMFLLLWGLLGIGVLILPPIQARFDRYLLVALAPWGVLGAVWAQELAGRRGYRAAAALTVLGLVFSVAALQDYLAWNHARWAGLRELRVAFAVPVTQINGGYEFNGWYHSDRFVEASRARGEKVFGPLGWWIVEDDYCVSLRRRERFEVIGRVPYFSWLGFERREMLLQRRVEEPELPL